jgi:hypothetical protein
VGGGGIFGRSKPVIHGIYNRIAHFAVFFQDAEIAKLSAMLKKAEMKTSSLGMS